MANGQLVFTHPKIFTTNFYSYTEPDHEFINHHWGTGVIFEAVRKALGFDGLSIFYYLLMLMAFLLVFDLALKQSSLLIATIMALLLMPIMTFRREIRPEGFSYFFCSLLLWMLWHIREKKIPFFWIYVFPVLMVVWTNIHIYFVFGPVLLFIFFCQILRKSRERKKAVLLVFFASVAATLFNPIGIRLSLYPLFIFREYGYTIIENQTLLFLIQRGLHLPVYTIFFVSAALFIVLLVVALARLPESVLSSENMVALIFLGLAFAAQRNLPHFGFFALVSLSRNAQLCLAGRKLTKFYSIPAYFAVGFALSYHLTDSFSNFNLSFRTGLMKTGQDSAAFFERNDVKGPIFNNYDIGSYLIYHLFPAQPVFVDNRPEAYSSSFFQETYIPMQMSERKWQSMDDKLQLNCIFFYRHDVTSWAQSFLIRRIRDPEWAPVFVDDFTLILLKRNVLNSEIIREYEVPKDIFVVETVR